jgi:glycosyltransferase involved in cell wall biosynthesis
MLLLFEAVRRSLLFRITGEKFDLVSTYDPLKTGFVGVICAKILGAKFAPEVNGVYASSAEYMDDKNSLPTKIKRRVYPFLQSIVLYAADGVKLLFPEQIDSFCGKNKIKIIRNFPNFVDVERFLNDRAETCEKQVLFVGFPFYRKGVDILIEAFKRIAGNYPEWKLLILGWYPNDRILRKHMDNHPQIFHHTPVEYHEMPKQIKNCSFLVLPSRSEAMGRILIEAMAAGKARIGANVDGIPQVIEHEKDGLLFEAGNADDLAKKMRVLIENPEFRAKLGRKSRERARREFSEEKYYRNITAFYHEVIDSC